MPEIELCAFYGASNRGDSGGPLTLKQTGELIGIMSYGVGRTFFIGYPTVYVRIDKFVEWIETKLAQVTGFEDNF